MTNRINPNLSRILSKTCEDIHSPEWLSFILNINISFIYICKGSTISFAHSTELILRIIGNVSVMKHVN